MKAAFSVTLTVDHALQIASATVMLSPAAAAAVSTKLWLGIGHGIGFIAFGWITGLGLRIRRWGEGFMPPSPVGVKLPPLTVPSNAWRLSLNPTIEPDPCIIHKSLYFHKDPGQASSGVVDVKSMKTFKRSFYFGKWV